MKRNLLYFTVLAAACALFFATCKNASSNGGDGDDPVVKAVVITSGSTTIVPGGEAAYAAVVTGDNLADTDKGVTWSVEDAESDDTEIDEDGKLKVGSDESAAALKVIAASAKTPSVKSDPRTVTVSKPEDNFTVTFMMAGGNINGSTENVVIYVTKNTMIPTADKPANPKRDGYTFDGWNNGATAWNFSSNVNGDLTLTATWTSTGSGIEVLEDFKIAAITLERDATFQIVPVFTPSSIANKAVTYTSNNTAYATVSATGLVTGVTPGSTTIKAVPAEDPDMFVTVNVTVTAKTTDVYPTVISLTEGGAAITAITLSINESKTFVIDWGTVTPTDGLDTVTWGPDFDTAENNRLAMAYAFPDVLTGSMKGGVTLKGIGPGTTTFVIRSVSRPLVFKQYSITVQNKAGFKNVAAPTDGPMWASNIDQVRLPIKPLTIRDITGTWPDGATGTRSMTVLGDDYTALLPIYAEAKGKSSSVLVVYMQRETVGTYFDDHAISLGWGAEYDEKKYGQPSIPAAQRVYRIEILVSDLLDYEFYCGKGDLFKATDWFTSGTGYKNTNDWYLANEGNGGIDFYHYYLGRVGPLSIAANYRNSCNANFLKWELEIPE